MNFIITSLGIGDNISKTPILRKYFDTYNEQVTVYSYSPELFTCLPYVKESILLTDDNKDIDGLRLNYHDEMVVHHDKPFPPYFPLLHNNIDIRQFSALHTGIMLLPEELHCDYVPEEADNTFWLGLPNEFVIVHAPAPATKEKMKIIHLKYWEQKNWQELCDKINIPVIQIGRNYNVHQTKIRQYKLNNVIDLVDDLSLDQVWHLCNKAKYVITTDSGILHLAGTTNVNIVQVAIGWDPFYCTPYRNGSQSYKVDIVKKNCKWCLSNRKIRAEKRIDNWFGNSNIIDGCPIKKENPDCQPNAEDVLNVIYS